MSDYGSTPPPPGPEGQPQGQPPAQQGYQGAPPPAPGYDGGAYGAPTYQNVPAGAPVAQPKSIAMAVKLMYVGAVLAVIGALTSLLMQDTVRETVEQAAEDTGTSMTSSEIDTAVAVGMGTAVVMGIIGALLWVLMAVMNGKGKKWARVVATVFFALSLVSFLVGLAQAAPALSRIISVITILLGAYIIFLLYRPESTQYYDAQSAPRV